MQVAFGRVRRKTAPTGETESVYLFLEFTITHGLERRSADGVFPLGHRKNG